MWSGRDWNANPPMPPETRAVSNTHDPQLAPGDEESPTPRQPTGEDLEAQAAGLLRAMVGDDFPLPSEDSPWPIFRSVRVFISNVDLFLGHGPLRLLPIPDGSVERRPIVLLRQQAWFRAHVAGQQVIDGLLRMGLRELAGRLLQVLQSERDGIAAELKAGWPTLRLELQLLARQEELAARATGAAPQQVRAQAGSLEGNATPDPTAAATSRASDGPTRHAADTAGAGAEAHSRWHRTAAGIQITWGGKTRIVKHSRGMDHLEQLLLRQPTSLSAWELSPPHHASAGVAEPILSEEAVRSLRERLAELRHANCVDAIEEGEVIQQQLQAATDKGGRPRLSNQEGDRSRKRVQSAVGRALREIKRVHPEVGRHLAIHIATGATCSYRADEQSWLVTRE